VDDHCTPNGWLPHNKPRRVPRKEIGVLNVNFLFFSFPRCTLAHRFSPWSDLPESLCALQTTWLQTGFKQNRWARLGSGYTVFSRL